MQLDSESKWCSLTNAVFSVFLCRSAFRLASTSSDRSLTHRCLLERPNSSAALLVVSYRPLAKGQADETIDIVDELARDFDSSVHCAPSAPALNKALDRTVWTLALGGSG